MHQHAGLTAAWRHRCTCNVCVGVCSVATRVSMCSVAMCVCVCVCVVVVAAACVCLASFVLVHRQALWLLTNTGIFKHVDSVQVVGCSSATLPTAAAVP